MTMVETEYSRRVRRDDGRPRWLRPASYWQPSHIVTSAWLEHAPFAFWLVDRAAPASIVELGTHHGFSFFVFAEAITRSGCVSTRSVRARHLGGRRPRRLLRRRGVRLESSRIAEREYPDRTHLLRGYFSESRPRIADGSVDLLHIDGRHGYEDVNEDFEQWVSTRPRWWCHPLPRHRGARRRLRCLAILGGDLARGIRRSPSRTGTASACSASARCRQRSLRHLFAADEADASSHPRRLREALGASSRDRPRSRRCPPRSSLLHAVVGLVSREAGPRISRRPTLIAIEQRDEVIIEYRESTSWRITAAAPCDRRSRSIESGDARQRP